MKIVRLLLAVLFVASSAVVSADDIDLFHRIQKSDMRVASFQESADVSDSYPTQYMDPEVLSDISTPLIEQQAVPAEAAVEGQLGGSAEYVAEAQIIDPIAADTSVACGCGEAPLQQNSWDAAPPVCCCAPARRLRRGHRGFCHARSACDVACDVCDVACNVCATPVCVTPVCVDPACVDPCAHGCHHSRRTSHRACRRACGGGSLLRHIRCCR